ncbi:MAG: putative holin-like toxin [Thermotaleaceae bacterium]
MSTYQAIDLMIMFGVLLISLISYLDRNNNQKK